MQSRMLSSPPKSITQRSIPRAMPPWGGAVGKSVEQETETLAGLLAADAQQVEDAGLDEGIMDTDRAAAGFRAVDHQVVGLRAAFAGIGGQQPQVLSSRGRERMVHGGPSLLFFVPGEHWKLDDPGEVPGIGVIKFKLGAQAACGVRTELCR